MSTVEAGIRVLGLALAAGLITYVYSRWYYRFALSRTRSARARPFVLRVLVVPPAVVVAGALLIPILDKSLFKLICDTEILLFGTPISIVLLSVPAILKMNAALEIVGLGRLEQPVSRLQVRAAVFILYLAALSLWLLPLRATHVRDVVLALIVAVGVSVIGLGWKDKLVARSSADQKPLVSQLITHLVIVSWLLAASTIYRAI